MLMSPHIRLRDVVKALASGMTISETMLVLSTQSIDLLKTRHLINLSVSFHHRQLCKCISNTHPAALLKMTSSGLRKLQS